jgi:hypothetical protein
MAYTNRIAFETLRTLDSSTLVGSYAAIGAPLAHPSYILKIVNNSTVLVTISINGTTDIDVLPASSFVLYDLSKVGGQGEIPAIAQGTQFYAKGSAGTGNIYLVTQYIINQ